MTGAVASAMVAPVAAFAAIDEQGMQYVSAGEGLGGSLRVNVLIDTNGEGDDVSSTTNSLRLWAAGDADLGGGMAATYYIELRNGTKTPSPSDKPGEDAVYVDAYDIGVRGPFGHVAFGHLGMVAPRMVPGANLAYEFGSERSSFAADPGDNGIRYESPVINGFQFGASGVLNGAAAPDANGDPSDDDYNLGDDNPDGSLDEFSLAVKYTLPVGLQLGAGFESKSVINATSAINLTLGNNDLGDMTAITLAIGTAAGSAVATVGNAITDEGDDMTGFRFGARYGQDNWLVAYEYRGYDGYNAGIAPETTVSARTGDASSTPATGKANDILEALFKNGFETNEYVVHAVGAQAKVDRFTMSANYSMEENTFTDYVEVTRDTIAVDAAYHLGSRSAMAIGWKKMDREVVIGSGTVSDDVSTTYLFYRVDF